MPTEFPLDVDPALVQDATYRFTPADRQYIDEQIRAIQTWALDAEADITLVTETATPDQLEGADEFEGTFRVDAESDANSATWIFIDEQLVYHTASAGASTWDCTSEGEVTGAAVQITWTARGAPISQLPRYRVIDGVISFRHPSGNVTIVPDFDGELLTEADAAPGPAGNNGDIQVKDGDEFAALTLGSALQILRTNASATGVEWVTTGDAATVDPTINGLRLTLTSATPVTTSDVATAATIYLTPFISGAISLYVGSAWVMRTTAEISLALGTLTSDKNYDVFAYDNSGTVTLELSAAWTNDTTRATAVTTQNGVTVKSGDATRRLVGTIRTISTTETCDTAAKRFVWNGPEPARQVRRAMLAVDTTNSWSGNTSSWAQADGSSANQVAYVSGTSYTLAQAHVAATASAASTTTDIAVGIGVDSTSANAAQLITASRSAAANGYTTVSAMYDGYPGLGYHYLAWLEQVSNTATFYGDNGTTTMQSGMRAYITG